MARDNIPFRKISDVARELDTEQHNLRYWESQFREVEPLKRKGGRRHYRPEDVKLLAGLKKLLHEDGMTVKGVQRRLAEEGVEFVREIGSDYLSGANEREGTESQEQPRRPESAEAGVAEEADVASSASEIRSGFDDEPAAKQLIELNALRPIIERLKDLRTRMASETL